MFAIEAPLLTPLPEEPFGTGRWFTREPTGFPRSRCGQPVLGAGAADRPVGAGVAARLAPVVFDGRTEVAVHQRLPVKGGTWLELDHYLETLLRKPGALPGATALEQARAAGRFTPVQDAWWAAVSKAHGDTAGTRALIEVLLLHRHMPHAHVVVGLTAALRAGAHRGRRRFGSPQSRRRRHEPRLRYLGLDVLARARLTPVPDTTTSSER